MATPGPHPAITAEGLPSQLPDIDPDETADWLESLDGLLQDKGRNRARFIMLKLLERARARQIGLPALRSSDYINTIPRNPSPGSQGMSMSNGGFAPSSGGMRRSWSARPTARVLKSAAT